MIANSLSGPTKKICSLSIVLLLAACGGNGGSNAPNPVPVNQNPVAMAGADQTVSEDTMVALAGSATDSDGTIASYSWTQSSGTSVNLTGANTATAEFTTPITTDILSLTFQLAATDDDGAIGTDSVTVQVEPVNADPTVDAGADQTVNELTEVTLAGTASDPDGSIAEYLWTQVSGPAVALFATNTASTSFDAPDVSVVTTVEFELTVTDNENALAMDLVVVTVNPVGSATSAKVSGIILSDGPLMDVIVSAGGVIATTNSAGAYVLNNVPVVDGMIQVTAEVDGFARQYKTLQTSTNNQYVANLTMLRYAVIESLDPTQPQTSTVTDVGGNMQLEFDIPANTFTGTAGETYTVNLAYGDPTTEDGKAVFPGDYLGADDASGANTNPLESIAFSEITIKDSQGTPITQFDQPALVTSRLPDVYQTGGARADEYVAGSTIPWWSYDEAAMIWVREDADHTTTGIQDALIVDMAGVLYTQAEVMHLTWWNVDQPLSEHACLTLTITDVNGDLVPFLEVTASGVTYDGVSRPAISDVNGEVSLTVFRSLSSPPERISLTAMSSGVVYPIQVIDAADGVIGTNEFYTPDTQGSTIDNNGECRSLLVVINIVVSRLYGNVIDEFTGAPSNGIEVFTSLGASATTDANGDYEILGLPVGQELNVFVDANNPQTVVIPVASNELELDFVKLNEPPVITAINKNPTGLIDNNSNASLSLSFFDIEGESVAIAWTIDAGTLDNPNASNVIWTAPVSGSGVATVTVVVTDQRGLTDSAILRIDYGQPVGFTVNISVFDNGVTTPAEGAYVILHDSVTGQPSSVYRADANGTVLIEDAPVRSIATIAHEFTTGLGANERVVRELITAYDVPQQQYDIVFYGDDLSCEDTSATVTFENYPDSIVTDGQEFGFLSGSFQGSTSSVDYAGRSLVFNSPQLCPSFGVQADGKFSMLGALISLDTNSFNLNNSVLAYGFLLDQDENAQEYVGQLDKVPAEINFTSQNGIHNLSIIAVRKNQIFLSGMGFNVLDPNNTPPQTSGTFMAAADFPADFFVLSADYEANDVMNFSYKNLATLPTGINLDTPAYTLENITYDFPTREISWQSNAGTEVDIAMFQIEGWEFYVPGETSEIILPVLPDAIKDWAATDTVDFFDFVYLSLSDIGQCAGYDQCLNLMLDNPQLGFGINQLEQTIKGVSYFGSMEVLNPPVQ